MRNNRALKGLAGAAALAGATQAYGAVIVDPTPANIVGHAPAASDNGTRLNLDVDGDGARDLSILYRNLSETNGALLLAYVYAGAGASAPGSVVGTSVSSQAYAYALPAGYSVGPTASFYQKAGYFGHIVTNYAGTNYGPGAKEGMAGVMEYVGFQFLNSGNTRYGYIQLEVDPYVSAANPGGIKFFKLAYDNSGAAILTGAGTAVPEPTSLAALAFGGLALVGVGLKRRKEAATA